MSAAQHHTPARAGSPAIGIHALTVDYGNHCGVNELDLEIHQGEVFALLGRNGSGKSTTLRTLLDDVQPTTGTVEVLGLDPQQDAAELRSRTGALVDDLKPMDGLSGRDLLWLCASVRGCDLQYAEALAEQLRLDLDRHVEDLSAGCLRALGIVQALMHDPEVVVLDEPTAGLDPEIRDEVHGMLRDVAVRGGTVLLSAHDLDDVADVADRAAVLREDLPALVVTITVDDDYYDEPLVA